MGTCPNCNNEINRIKCVVKEVFIGYWDQETWKDYKVDEESSLDYCCPICNIILFSGIENEERAREFVRE